MKRREDIVEGRRRDEKDDKKGDGKRREGRKVAIYPFSPSMPLPFLSLWYRTRNLREISGCVHLPPSSTGLKFLLIARKIS